MSEEDTTTDQTDDTSTMDISEAAAGDGAVATEAPQSRFWGVIPSEWELVEGSEVYDVNPSYTPNEEEITYIEMDALDTELPFPKYTTRRKAADYSGKLFREGDTLFARITPCTENGKTAFVDEMETDVGIGSTEYAVLSPDHERIHPLYLYYVAKSHPVRNYAISRMRGSTGRQRVPFDVFRKEMDISLPPIEEQQRIITVLHNIDNLVQNTRELRNKKLRIKNGISQDLFSNGIRDEPLVETNSRFGSLPESWEVLNLSDIAEVVGGTTPSTDVEEYWDGDILWATPTDITSLEGPTISDTEDHITQEGLEAASLEVLPPNSVLMTSRATIGACAVNEVEMATNQGFKSLIPTERVQTWYLYYLIEHISDYLDALGSGSTFSEISKSAVEKVSVPVPPIDVQEQIGEKLQTLDESIVLNKQYEQRLLGLKSGLMQDLMTGQVRTEAITQNEVDT